MVGHEEDRRLRRRSDETLATPSGDETVAPPGYGEPETRRGGAVADLPRQIGPYAIERELARGGVGAVFVARHRDLDRRVALKVLLAGIDTTGPQRRRFELEAQAVARLRHPNIVGIHEIGWEGGCPFLAMDLIEGESLRSDRASC